MKFGHFQALNVTIFDEAGKIITELNTLKNSHLSIKNNNGYLFLKDALLDKKLLEFIGTSEEDDSSDFDKYLNKQKYSTTITFNSHFNKKCKIVGNGLLRNVDDANDKEFLFEIPTAMIKDDFDFIGDCEDLSQFDFAFQVLPFNNKGDLFKMHIE